MQDQHSSKDLSQYRVRKRFTILQFMGGLALIGIILTVILKIVLKML